MANTLESCNMNISQLFALCLVMAFQTLQTAANLRDKGATHGVKPNCVAVVFLVLLSCHSFKKVKRDKIKES